jgi:hypothetical protein
MSVAQIVDESETPSCGRAPGELSGFGDAFDLLSIKKKAPSGCTVRGQFE